MSVGGHYAEEDDFSSLTDVIHAYGMVVGDADAGGVTPIEPISRVRVEHLRDYSSLSSDEVVSLALGGVDGDVEVGSLDEQLGVMAGADDVVEVGRGEVVSLTRELDYGL